MPLEPPTITVAPRTARAESKFSATRSMALLDRILFLGMVAVLLFGPLAFGAVEEWAVLTLQCASALLFILWIARQLLAEELDLPAFAQLKPLLAFTVLIIAQLLLGTTVYRHATFSGLMVYLAYGMLFIVAAHVSRSEEQLRWLVAIVTVFGFLLAVLAVMQDYLGNGKLLWLRATEYQGAIYGPYVNHNHYAGLMELLTPLPLVVALSRHASIPQRMLAGFVAIVMGGTIFLSLSRGGMIAFVFEITFLSVCFLGLRKGLRSGLLLGAVFVMTMGFFFWMNGNTIFERVSGTNFQADASAGRWATVKDSLPMFYQKPIAGWGLDTFPVVYPQFRSYYTNIFVNEAHNDHLQLLVETGLTGFFIMAWFVAVTYRNGFRKLRSNPASWASTMTLAALTGCTGLLIHGLTDFNLHIPANAAIFFAWMALAGCSAVTVERNKKVIPLDSVRPANKPPEWRVESERATGDSSPR